MDLKAELAATKEKRAGKIAVLADTTIMEDKNMADDETHTVAQQAFRLRPHLLKILASVFDKHIERMPHGIVQLVDLISCFLCGCSLYNLHEQLHLDEFVGLQMKRINDAIDMDIFVRKKPFRDEDQGGFINDVDSADEGDKKRNLIQSEFLGGAGEDDAEEIEDIEGDPSVQRQAVIKLSLDDCKAMLRRDQELERASAPDRHK